MKKIYILSIIALFAGNSNAFSLLEGLDLVYKQNPALQTVKNEVNVQNETKNQARAGFLPNIKASYNISDTHTNLEKTLPSMESSPSLGEVELIQPLFTGGATFAGYKAAKYNTKSAVLNYKAQQQNLFQSAANAYLSVLTATEVLKFNQQQVKTNTEEMKRIRQRFDLGDITLPALKEFEARLSSYIAHKEVAKGDLIAAKATFANIFGRPAENLIWPELNKIEDLSLEQAIEKAKAKNPTVNQSKLKLKASRENITIARSGFMPTVAAFAKWSNRSNFASSADYNSTSIGMQASMPLFTGGATKAKYAKAKYQKTQAKDLLQQSIRDIIKQTSTAYSNVNVLEAQLNALKIALVSYSITTDAIEKQEAAGEASIIDVLDSRDDELQAKVNVELAKQKLTLAKLSLLAALGKLTHKDLINIFAPSKERMPQTPDLELAQN